MGRMMILALVAEWMRASIHPFLGRCSSRGRESRSGCGDSLIDGFPLLLVGRGRCRCCFERPSSNGLPVDFPFTLASECAILDVFIRQGGGESYRLFKSGRAATTYGVLDLPGQTVDVFLDSSRKWSDHMWDQET